MQIYHASEEYGIEDIRTSGGYFHLGKVFHELSRDDVAESMFDRVCKDVSLYSAVLGDNAIVSLKIYEAHTGL